MKSFKALKLFLESASDKAENVDHWEAEPGTQYGSNPGGVHTDPETGQKHYVKFYDNEHQAKTEVAAAKVSELLGVKTLKPKLVRKDGKLGVSTEWNTNLETRRPSHFEEPTEAQAHSIGAMHHAAVLTKNWDVVGLVHDNIMFDKKTNEPYSVDQGGSFEYRAQGGSKPYGEDIAEVESFKSGLNPSAHHVFSHAFGKFPEAEKNSLTHVRNLNYNDVQTAFRNAGLEDHKQRADTLWKRRELLLKHYGS